MRNEEKGSIAGSGWRTGTILYITDIVNDSQSVLDFACELAERHDAHLELLHVVDPEHTPSKPDLQMGIKYSLEALARSLKSLNRNTEALIMFGTPEDIISKRAADTNAIIIAIPMNNSVPEHVLTTLVRHLTQKCSCPVLMLPPNVRKEDTSTFSMRGCISLTRRVREGGLARIHKSGAQA